LHHIAKTHHGWQIRLEADGTVTISSPHGQSYRSPPPTAVLFPQWNITTPMPDTGAVAPEAGPHKARSALAIPRRSRTRAAERAWRIQAERDDNHIVNAAYDAELERALGPGSGVPTSARAAAPRPTGSPYSELIPDEPPPF
jgi:hypothetical protein